MAANDTTEHPNAEPSAAEQTPPAQQPPADPTALIFQAPDFSQVPVQRPRPQKRRDEESEDDHRDRGHDSGSSKSGPKRQRGSSRDRDRERTDQSTLDNDEPVARRRRKRRRGRADLDFAGGTEDDPENTITRIRAPRQATGGTGSTGKDEVTAVRGSTRLEAKRQRRRDNRRERRRGHIVTEAEFLARRESVERKMMVRQREDRIQIGVMEDGVLAEHFVSNTTQDSLIGNIYLGKVQNVLPSMEAAFVDIGRGRNAVLYAGEVNWDVAQLDGKAKKIENALKSGDTVLVQVTKDPVDHKGARLTAQISLPGRYLVYVPGGSMTGISRKLPDTERVRLKKILKEHLPDKAGVIVRTAAEGTSEEELMNDINRLRAQWEEIEAASKSTKVLAPELLHSEPDLTIKVVRDVFNEDFTSMVVQGQEVWDKIEAYVTYVAPDLRERMSQWIPEDNDDVDLFQKHRIDEQLRKALERKVNLPSGGSLVIDRTEAMTVVDINTGKFTGSGGNLEETVTKNNLEAAEEIVRQLRLRDIGGIIVIDFIDMVLEENRDLVLRRLVECLGRDRTKHQVSEVTSLGLVQMTRKRMGTGLIEVFSETCDACNGRGIIVHDHPVEKSRGYDSHGNPRRRNESRRRRRQENQDQKHSGQDQSKKNDRNGKDQGKDHHETPEPSREEQQANAEREARAAQNRQAMNQIAAAGKDEIDDSADHKDDRRDDHKDDRREDRHEAQDSSSKSKGRQRKRRRASSAPQTTGRVTGRVSHVSATDESKDEQKDSAATIQSAGEQRTSGAKRSAESKPATEAKARRPRRRAASSGMGEDTIQTVTDAGKESGASFTATAVTPAQTEKPKQADQPVMLGVGVAAEDIVSPGTKNAQQKSETD